MSVDYTSTSQINKIPSYPDAGTKYEGFSKTLKGNFYNINKQEPLITHSDSDVNFNVYTVAEGKACYITDIILQSPGASTNGIYLSDGVLGSTPGMLFIYQFANFEIVLHFEVPIKFTNAVRISLTIGSSQRVYANIIGWIEDE